jgi:2Fe-2S ferredoxin
MARVHFVDVDLSVEVPVGSSILTAARAVRAPEGSRCGGVCACSTCHVYVLSGSERLSPPTDDELDLLLLSARERRESSRLGCQARVVSEGEVRVAISEESFLAFLDGHPEDREHAMQLWSARRPP